MSEQLPWPEPHLFLPDSSPKLRCAEIVAETLVFAGSEVVFPHGDTVRTNYVDSTELRDNRYQDALRLEQCIYNSTPLFAKEGNVTIQEQNVPQELRAFALQHGVLDTQKLDLDDKSFDVEETDYSWQSIVWVVVDMRVGGPLNESMITLFDVVDGSELDEEKTMHVLGMLESLYSGLRSQVFSDGLLIDSIEEPVARDESIPRPTSELGTQYSEFTERCLHCGSAKSDCTHFSAQYN